MTEIDCFIEFQNAEPFMMSIDKEVDYQTFDEEIKKRLSTNIKDNLLYSYNSTNGETLIQNNNDLANALAYAESFGDDFLFVINIAEKPKHEETEEENELKELEELENLVPEDQKGTSFSIHIEQQPENVKDDKKETEKKDERVDFLEFLKNQISEQLPALSPILESLNIENIINNVNSNNNNNDNKDNKREEREEIPNFIKQFLPVVFGNLQNLPNVFPIPPPSSQFHPFAHAFPCHSPPPPPSPSPSQFHPFSQAFPFPFPVPSPHKSSECKSTEQVPDLFSFLSGFVPPPNQSPNPLQFSSLNDLLNGALNYQQKSQNKCQENKPKQRQQPVQFHSAVCDHCSEQILGIRYKCLSCPDFDLCEKCEVNSPQIHNPDHVFAKIRYANQTIAPSQVPPPPPQCRPPMHQRVHHPHPHLHPHPHPHPFMKHHFHPHSNIHPMKPNVVRPAPRPHVHPQFHAHPNIHRVSPFSAIPPRGCKHARPVPPPFVQSHPIPAPENDRIKSLEEQIATIESSIANIKSSLSHQREEPKPRAQPIFNHYSFGDSDDDSDDSDDDSDQVFEIKVNRRF